MSRLHPLLLEFANEDRQHDPWGACLSIAGPVCDVMTAIGEASSIPPSAGYRPAAGLRGREDIDTEDAVTGENYHTAAIFVALDNGSLTHLDLEYAIRVFDRYADQLVLAGKDY